MSDLIPWMSPWSGRLLTLTSVVAGLVVVVYALFLHGRSRRQPRCPTCWYNLTGLPADRRCPECGRDISLPSSRYRTRRFWKLAFVGLLLSAALPAYTVRRRVQVWGWRYYTWMPPLVWVLPDEVRQSFCIGDYVVEVQRDRRPYLASEETFRVLSEGKLDVQLRGWAWSIDHGSMGEMIDLDDNGQPEVLVSEFGHGAGPYPTYVVELGATRAIVVGKYWTHEDFVADVDGDRRRENVAEDHTFSFWQGRHYSSPPVRIPLRFRSGNAFEPAPEKMRRPAMSESELAAIAQRVRAKLSLPAAPLSDGYELWETMVALIFSGHSGRAYAFLDEAWPPARAGKAQFAQEFAAKLAESPYASVAEALGHSPKYRVESMNIAEGHQ